MYSHKKCIAMLLAGGQGSRLKALTTKVAKPAVSFGSKYRIIDFTLSNCSNSDIDTVGVLTQYQPLILNEYIGNGQPWDLDRLYGGVHVLPPYQAKDRMEWYKGTANAIYQNIPFIENYHPDHVLILSGDHIYKMDYQKMLEEHINNDADCTIAVRTVPIEEASRFGIMNTDDNNRIIEFEEKPAHPKSNKASMGIYIFKTDKLFEYLRKDAMDEKSSNDFGKNIIPTMLNEGMKMIAYPFEGYWKDVGTISSLWEANQDLLGNEPNFDIYDTNWKIYSRNNAASPAYLAPKCELHNSLVATGSKIYGTIINSVIGKNVTIEEGAIVRDSVIFSDTVIGKNSVVEYSIIDENVKIGAKCKIGLAKEEGKEITVIGRNVKIKNSTTVDAGANLEEEM